MLELGRTLFLEEWLASVLVLLAVFFSGYAAWYLTKGRTAKAKRSAAAVQATARPPRATEAPVHAGEVLDAQRNEDLERLEAGLEDILAGSAEFAPPEACPDPEPEILAQVEQGLKGLDAFGLTFQKMQAFNDPNASLQKISQAITADLVFSSTVLKTANSPYFGMQGQISSLHHACLVLGLNNLKTLYFRDHFKMLARETGRMVQVRSAVWRHSIVTAILASHLAKAFRIVPQETAFTLGLLHDLGKLVLTDMVEQREAQGEDLLDFSTAWSVEEEYRRLGVDHAWIGRRAATLWQLPAETAMVIGAHHSLRLDPAPPPSDAAKAQLLTLAVANQLSRVCLEQAASAPLPLELAKTLNNGPALRAALRDPRLLEELEIARNGLRG